MATGTLQKNSGICRLCEHTSRLCKSHIIPEFCYKRILESEPGETTTYGVIVFPLLFQGEHLRDFMVGPTPGRMFGGNRVYRFVFGGFMIIILVSAHLPEPRFVRLFLRDEGAIKLYPRELTDFPFLRDIWNLAGETTKDVKI